MVIPLRDWLVFGPEWVSNCGDSRLLASRVQTSAEVNGIARKAVRVVGRLLGLRCFSFKNEVQVDFRTYCTW